MSAVCLSCDDWGCTRCALEKAEKAGGEQGLSAAELEVQALRAENERLIKEVGDHENTRGFIADVIVLLMQLGLTEPDAALSFKERFTSISPSLIAGRIANHALEIEGLSNVGDRWTAIQRAALDARLLKAFIAGANFGLGDGTGKPFNDPKLQPSALEAFEKARGEFA